MWWDRGDLAAVVLVPAVVLVVVADLLAAVVVARVVVVAVADLAAVVLALASYTGGSSPPS